RLAWALTDHPELLTGSGTPGTDPRSAAADRLAGRRRGPAHRAAPMPALPADHHLVQAAGGNLALPQLCRQVPRRDLLAVRRAPRSGGPRRARRTVVAPPSDHRSGEPGNL